jgi:hypothetical protein
MAVGGRNRSLLASIAASPAVAVVRAARPGVDVILADFMTSAHCRTFVRTCRAAGGQDRVC